MPPRPTTYERRSTFRHYDITQHFPPERTGAPDDVSAGHRSLNPVRCCTNTITPATLMPGEAVEVMPYVLII